MKTLIDNPVITCDEIIDVVAKPYNDTRETMLIIKK